MFKLIALVVVAAGIAVVAYILTRARSESAPKPLPPRTRRGAAPPTPRAAAKPTGRPNWLIGVNDHVAGKPYFIGMREVMIGRAPDNFIQLRDTDASREHAKLSPAPNDGLMLTDLDSSNGTFVNGERVLGSRVLKDGDEIRVGELRFTYQARGEHDTTQALLEVKRANAKMLQSTNQLNDKDLKAMIETTVRESGGNLTVAAEHLGVPVPMLEKMLTKYGIPHP